MSPRARGADLLRDQTQLVADRARLRLWLGAARERDLRLAFGQLGQPGAPECMEWPDPRAAR